MKFRRAAEGFSEKVMLAQEREQLWFEYRLNEDRRLCHWVTAIPPKSHCKRASLLSSGGQVVLGIDTTNTPSQHVIHCCPANAENLRRSGFISLD
jgi:hypothetical protein